MTWTGFSGERCGPWDSCHKYVCRLKLFFTWGMWPMDLFLPAALSVFDNNILILYTGERFICFLELKFYHWPLICFSSIKDIHCINQCNLKHCHTALYFLGHMSDWGEYCYGLASVVIRRALTLGWILSLIHISEPTRPLYISYAVFCLKKNI